MTATPLVCPRDEHFQLGARWVNGEGGTGERRPQSTCRFRKDCYKEGGPEQSGDRCAELT